MRSASRGQNSNEFANRAFRYCHAPVVRESTRRFRQCNEWQNANSQARKPPDAGPYLLRLGAHNQIRIDRIAMGDRLYRPIFGKHECEGNRVQNKAIATATRLTVPIRAMFSLHGNVTPLSMADSCASLRRASKR